MLELIFFSFSLSVSLRRTFVIAFGALLETHRQIGDSKVSGCTRETGVLTGTRANLAGLVTRPANAALIREASRRAATDACAGKKRKR